MPQSNRSNCRRGVELRQIVQGLAGTFLLVTGCASYVDPNVPEIIQRRTEPQYQTDYLLYQPSQYSRRASWPLVVVCCGSWNDSPDKIIRDWTQFAEAEGFLVAAPSLQKDGGWLWTKSKPPPDALHTEEDRLLAVVQHVRAGHEISEDRIFLFGRSTGAYAALSCGLRHADVFRAVALSKPKYDPRSTADIASQLDLHQPIYVEYTSADRWLGGKTHELLDWLRENHMELTASSTADLRRDAAPLVGFFEDVIRNKPWVHILAEPAPSTGPLAVRFALRRSFEPSAVKWDFGNGERGSGTNPLHRFATRGAHPITATLFGPDGSECSRSIMLTVPDLVISSDRNGSD